jgi:hypothetical protein
MPRKKALSADFDQFSSSITDSIFDTLAAHPSSPIPSSNSRCSNSPITKSLSSQVSLIRCSEPSEHKERQHQNDSLPYAVLRRAARFEDSYTRQTFFLRNDLAERLNKIAAQQSKGFKMRLINHVLENALDDFEQSGFINGG